MVCSGKTFKLVQSDDVHLYKYSLQTAAVTSGQIVNVYSFQAC